MWRSLAALGLVLFVSSAVATEDKREKPGSPVDQYNTLVDDFEETGGTRQFAVQFFELAKQHRGDPAAVDALVWILKNRGTKPEAARAIELLGEHHLEDENLGAACQQIAGVPATGAERLLRAVMEKSPRPQTRAAACYYLARLLEEQISIVARLKMRPDLADRFLQYYGDDYGKHLSSLDHGILTGELEKVYTRMAASFSDQSIHQRRLGAMAGQALFRIRHLSVGRVAPETMGQDIFGDQFKLSDYRGKVVVLSFWGHW